MGKQTITFELSIDEEIIMGKIREIWVNLLGNNPADLTEDKIDIIEGALNDVLMSKIVDDEDFFGDVVRSAIEKADVE